jgi:1-acyl-sn-glycerol-3-phosphate acyltransferase
MRGKRGRIGDDSPSNARRPEITFGPAAKGWELTMNRLPLADQLPYRFYPPKINAVWVYLGQFYIRSLLRRDQKVHAIDVSGVEHLRPLLERGDGVLLTPNHGDHADCGVMYHLGSTVRRPFYYMAAYQIFRGMNRIHLPRLGVFPVDREGSDLKAFKTGVEILTQGANPLVVFPEGEIYHMADRLTPFREGAAALAATAAKRTAEAGKTVWIVPAAIKYRFLDSHDPLPALDRLMDDLEARFTWWPRAERSLVERIYAYAEGMLALKELEYFGASKPGDLKERIGALRCAILDRLEDKRLGKRTTEPVPVRVKELRRACLDRLADAATTPSEAAELRRDLNDIFVAVQLFSYPGDYIRDCPTVERVAEILMKFEQDVLGADDAKPRAPRRAVLRLGEPLDGGAFLKAAGKPRQALPALTTELETRIQSLLDQIGPGRPLPNTKPASTTPSEPAPAGSPV